jgi:lysophospholipase L1-like esterase
VRARALFVALLISSLTFAILSEIVVRALIVTNQDGARFLLTLPLRPFRLPIEETRATLARYAETAISELVYDPNLGWTNRPNLPDYNAAGMRADRDYPLTPPADRLRIAAFGDSFTHGNEVERVEAWATLLMGEMLARGAPAEVLNFGVGGYGVDQAYLRWQQQGRAYQPDMVLLGFVEADVPRMLSMYWKLHPGALAVPGANPFTKPRFTLGDDGALRLINQPTPLPAAIPGWIAALPTSEYAPYEYYYDPDDYAEAWWQHSAALSLLDALRRYLRVDLAGVPRLQLADDAVAMRQGSEAYRLALAVIGAWAEAARDDGACFVIVHLPLRSAVIAHQAGEPPHYAALRDELRAAHPWIETLDAFPRADLDAQFAPGGHYSPAGSRLIAAAIADQLAASDAPC